MGDQLVEKPHWSSPRSAAQLYVQTWTIPVLRTSVPQREILQVQPVGTTITTNAKQPAIAASITYKFYKLPRLIHIIVLL